ncbi:MAG: hypothetical protein ACOVR6_03580 [Fimbriimonas sp.]
MFSNAPTTGNRQAATIRNLEKFSFFLYFGIGGTVAVLLIFGTISKIAVSSDKAKITSLKSQSDDLTKKLKSIDTRTFTPVSQSPVEDFQDLLDAACKRNSCLMGEFSVSSDWTPFVTKYSKENKEKGWVQTEVKMMLVGNASSINRTLAETIRKEVPFEFDSIEYGAIESKIPGRNLTAKISLRLLKKEKV